jgi:hypothetical protein
MAGRYAKVRWTVSLVLARIALEETSILGESSECFPCMRDGCEAGLSFDCGNPCAVVIQRDTPRKVTSFLDFSSSLARTTDAKPDSRRQRAICLRMLFTIEK